MERKLTAILCADVHGYSRLMGGDEEATLATLTAHRKIIDRLIEQHHGRFVNSAGEVCSTSTVKAATPSRSRHGIKNLKQRIWFYCFARSDHAGYIGCRARYWA